MSVTTWIITIRAEIEADNAEDAEAVSQRLVDRVLEHPSAIEAEAWTEPAGLLGAVKREQP